MPYLNIQYVYIDICAYIYIYTYHIPKSQDLSQRTEEIQEKGECSGSTRMRWTWNVQNGTMPITYLVIGRIWEGIWEGAVQNIMKNRIHNL